ncbi:NADH:flavin oxidoreductase/NADH oxidase [Dyella sp. A6]|uniref:NADH:flavin oxidoreductase/NADH oxidase n=1 Tax=Dyella aluminiiresistens TaxID=3069105 RepID=UPI002E786699|nr:NADH:flavin oxidoreductase/NADH oxidase [Dyella sp. A6]
MTALFSPFQIKGVTLRNRIGAPPMCQYAAEDGFVSNWHVPHYAMLARGGAGLVVVEATAVSSEGRITPGDLGLWRDEQMEGLASIAQVIKEGGAVPGIQLAHAGRKAGCARPWDGGAPLDASDPQAWQPIAPSSVPYMPGSSHVPREMSLQDIEQTQRDFVDAARRAAMAGFQWLELHFAHGFLGQSFLSRSSNVRTDRYGGSLVNRARFLVETVAAVRAVWPEPLPLSVRIGTTEFGEQETEAFEETVFALRLMKDAGLDLVDLSLSLSTPGEPVPWSPNLLVPYAEIVRNEVGLPVTTSWLITDAKAADNFVREGKADLLLFGRTLLANPHWPRLAAKALDKERPDWVLPASYAHWLQNW